MAPAPKPAAACSYVASVCPIAATTPEPDELGDEVERAGELRREGHRADAALPGLEQLAQHERVGGEQALRALRATAGGGEERALEMDAGDLAGAGELGRPAQLLAHRLDRLRHERDERARGATAAVVGDRGRHVVGALGDVGAAAAVHVQVDEPGQQPRAVEIDESAAAGGGSSPT